MQFNLHHKEVKINISIIKAMRHQTFFFLLLSLISLITLTQSKLVYLLQIARHGAKYPSKNVSATIDPPNLKGQLTGVGQRQHYNLGSYLYHDYIAEEKIVSGKLNARQAEFFTSSYQRAIDSAYAQLYGLFPTQESHIIPQNFPKQLLQPPFDIESNLNKEEQKRELTNTPDYALNKGFQPPPILVDDSLVNYCPNYGSLYSQRLKDISRDLLAFQQQHKLQISKLTMIFNASLSSAVIPSMADLYDNVIASIYLGRQMPKEFSNYDLKNLRFLNDYFNLKLQTGDFGEILATPLLRFIIQRFNQVQLKQTEKKLTVFLCHAENIFELQAILNLTSIKCLTDKWNNKTVNGLNCMDTPDFASNLIFQIHENDETFSYDVKVKYNGQYAYLCEKKSQTCPMDVFLDRLGQYIHDDFEKQCGVSVNDTIGKDNNNFEKMSQFHRQGKTVEAIKQLFLKK